MLIHSSCRAILRLCGISCFCIAAAFAQTTTYTITTLAGNGTVPGSWTGDAGPATQAELNVPTSAVIDSKGNLYIADSANNRVRYVTGGTITTAAGDGTAGFYGDTGTGGGVTGQAGYAELNTPSGVVLDSSGNLYIADTINNVIRMVTPGGVISTVVGVNGYTGNSFNGDGGSATLASLSKPSAMLYDSAGNFYIADTNNNAIRKVTAKTGIITTVAGTGDPTGLYNGDNRPAVKATLNHPVGIALDASGNLYIADTGNHVIRKVTNGVITTVAGNGTPGYAGDGKKVSPATQLNSPKGVAVDSAGNIYIADTTNSRIRMIGTDNTITTIAGTGGFGYSGDNGPATSAALNFPSQISMDSKGNIYVADTNNNVVRLLTPSSPSSGGGGVLPVIRTTQGVITAGAFGASSSVAPGTWVEIYGSNLAADTRTWTSDDFTNGGQKAPVSLDRTSVTISGQQAYIDYISPTQVNALLPLVSPGTQQLTITTAAGNSASYPINVSTNQFAVYAPPQFVVGGNQYVGAIFNDGTFVMPPNSVSGFTSRQAHPGETITIFGIGFGPASNGLQPGQLSAGLVSIKGTVQVLFGTAPAVIGFAGLAPGTFGLYQLNVVVPAIPSSDQVPLTITLNGVKGTQTLYTAVQ
jgi:uncharacterized protein (TIGR03437 family)